MTTQERIEIRNLLDETSLQVRAILKATAAHYHVTVERMCSVLKIARVSHARQMAIYAMRELIKTADGKPLSYPKLGVIFSRDHSTAINAWRVIDLARSNGRRLEVDDYMRRMRSVLSL